MQYDCGDILFDFFFRGDCSITCLVDSRLDVESAMVVDNDLDLAVESSIAVLSDITFDVKTISVSAICLGVEFSGWRDSRLALSVTEQNTTASHQIQFNVREEDWFTN